MARKGKAHRKRIPKPIFEDQILVQNEKDGKWYIGKRQLTKDDLTRLRDEAKQFRDSLLAIMVFREIHYLAYMQATNKATTPKDVEFANSMYQNLERIEEFIKRCAAL